MYKKQEIGKRLAEFADKIGSKAKLAEQLGILPQSLTNYFNGETAPGEKLLIKLESIGCDVAWLMFGVSQNQQVEKPYLSSSDELLTKVFRLETENNLLKQQLKEQRQDFLEMVKELSKRSDSDIKPNSLVGEKVQSVPVKPRRSKVPGCAI